MSRMPGGIRTALHELPLIAAYAVFAATLSVDIGQDVNFDLLNYHFYTPYFLLNARFERDILAAGLQSFLNPMLDLPFYAAVRAWNVRPVVIGVILGGIHGLTLWLVHKLTVLLMPGVNRRRAFFCGVLAAATSAFGAAFYGEIASTMHDNSIAILVLAALAILLSSIRDDVLPLRSVLFAGLIIGMAAGAKLVALIYAIGLAAACTAANGTLKDRVSRTLSLAMTVVLGAIVSGGYWAWLMWKHFESPLFPFYNAVFRSSLAPIENFSDRRFLPSDLTQSVFYPLLLATRQSLAAEVVFRDGRLAAALLALAVLAVIAIRSPHRGADSVVTRERLLMVAVFWIVSYSVWLEQFSYYRYVVPLESLASALIVASLVHWMTSFRVALTASAVICVGLIATTRPLDYGRVPWFPSYFDVDEKPLSNYRGATVLMWGMPNGYIVPFFPDTAAFLRIDESGAIRGWNAMRKRVEERIRSAEPDSLYLLETSASFGSIDLQTTLARFGLTAQADRCSTISTIGDPSRLCALRRSR